MRLALLLVMSIALTGCSWLIHDRENDYLQAKEHASINVPAEVALVSFKPQLVIPKVADKELPEEFSLPRPQALVLEALPVETPASLAAEQKTKLEAKLVKDGNGTPILRLNVGFARGWSALGNSLKKSEVTIKDLNRSIGTYYVELVKGGKPKEPGFWGRLFGSEPELEKQSLQVKLNQARSGVYVAIHVDQDNLAPEQQAQSLLKQIKENI